MKPYLVFLLAILLITSCANAPTAMPDKDKAQSALVSFLSSLNTGNYNDAVALYAGSYEQLQIFNPEIDPGDRAALWAWACDNKLLQCLKVRNAMFKEEQGNTFTFQVEFSNPDGSLFVLGPCCGAGETEMPPVSQFEYRVAKNTDGKFLVMDTPPYVP